MARRSVQDFNLNDAEVLAQEELHKKVDQSVNHKPSLSGERNLDQDLPKKKPGPKPKFKDKKVQLNFSGIPEPVRTVFDTFSKNLKQTDGDLVDIGKKDVLLLALADYGIPIPEKYLPDIRPNKVNRDNAANLTIKDIIDN
ncbi:hypothetical protein MTBPR1_80176 [Candidatus Terasakiella magnetica]|uniref:Uncharacterized protein n=1 Tax=Candidatus Terasakiella magnetica TaxID=1867952 RepID=A0A1C3RLE4_9PROT|nr:hypothetical protein [Candidatus Terasakiella magnetica]SCA58122.1 hypothetical protein MTBPR1_80176 [Candidatus Terasakiella magnetica]